MTCLISSPVAWAAIGYLAIIVGGRLLFFRDTLVDQVLNRLYLCAVVTLLLFRCTSMPSVTGLAYQFGLGCILFTSAHLATLASAAEPELDPGTVWRRHRWYTALALAATASILVAGTSARNEGRPIELTTDWHDNIVGISFGVTLTLYTVLFSRAGLRELRSDDLAVPERLVCWIMAGVMVYLWVCEALSITQTLTGWPALGPQLPRIAANFTLTIVVTATMAAIPLMSLVVAGMGLDSAARSCRRLWPLWRDLTAAVPEIVLTPATSARTEGDATARLLRMTVEIRDALLHLGPYLPPATAVSVAPVVSARPRRGTADPATITYIHQLAHAAEARKTGLRPKSPATASQLPLLANDFATELRQLLNLARAWSAATRSTERLGSGSLSRRACPRRPESRFPPR
ncbi:hypothetical protein DFR70_105500 [Nocardia tenerifensis]|uniref:DUF6545 domain-containing protein n=1 Tax=Nocardia tenerifensis TaxID=228006 RepID=A0A318KPP7_9NOCA|nr:MAB_1171c family putative transporter [Nocardia tenerifensis]PXX64315.1 hypothetical protein DFR70_105500 [Nocardia tenerifensis]